jgi:hypothetical protein
MRRYNKCRLYPYLKRILDKANKVKKYSYHSKYGPNETVFCSKYEYLTLKLYNDVYGLNDAEYAELQRYNKIKRLYKCLNFKY